MDNKCGGAKLDKVGVVECGDKDIEVYVLGSHVSGHGK